MSRFDAGKVAYEAFWANYPDLTWDEWEELPAITQEAWANTAQAVREAYSGH